MEMKSDYLKIRQDFFGGHNGSSFGEVMAITIVNQLSHFLMITILSLIPVLSHKNNEWKRYIIEFIVTILPFIFCVTFLSEHILLVLFVLILSTFVVIVFCFFKRESKPFVIKELVDLKIPFEGRLPFLSNLFANLLICVCIAILGVDFRLFPRRFAKTEIYGVSLMDVGVGCFVAINGGFSPESRLGTLSGYKPIDIFSKTILSTIPLIVLGFQRLIAVKSVDYYENITEYGLHWNFFFTLAFTKLFSTTFCCLFTNKVNIGFCGIVLVVVHQICLSMGLSQFIQNEDRNGFFAANKEGIISLMGYISLYLVFVGIGRYVFQKKRTRVVEWFQITFVVLLISLISGILMILSHTFIENVSRREVNLSYVFWLITISCIFIALEFIIQSIIIFLQYLNILCSGDDYNCIIFPSIGFSGMLVFLVSNLLTGLVNFTIDTISASDIVAFIVLIVYSIILSFISVFCYKYKIQFKIPFKKKSD